MVCEGKIIPPVYFRRFQSRKLPFFDLYLDSFRSSTVYTCFRYTAYIFLHLTTDIFSLFFKYREKKSAPDTKFREQDFWFYERQQAQPVLPHTAKMFVTGHTVKKHFRFLGSPKPFGLEGMSR